MLTHLILIALTLPPAFGGHADHHREVSHVAGWTLRVHKDPFDERLTCRLSKPKISYLRQALVFDLSRRTDTSGAVYRIDAGQPVAARTDEMELAHLGFGLHADDLDNPSGGLVRIPARRAAAARGVSIEAAPNRRPITFKIAGFDLALDAAKKAGCSNDDFR